MIFMMATHTIEGGLDNGQTHVTRPQSQTQSPFRAVLLHIVLTLSLTDEAKSICLKSIYLIRPTFEKA